MCSGLAHSAANTRHPSPASPRSTTNSPSASRSAAASTAGTPTLARCTKAPPSSLTALPNSARSGVHRMAVHRKTPRSDYRSSFMYIARRIIIPSLPHVNPPPRVMRYRDCCTTGCVRARQNDDRLDRQWRVVRNGQRVGASGSDRLALVAPSVSTADGDPEPPAFLG